jgi:hypothetical protein
VPPALILAGAGAAAIGTGYFVAGAATAGTVAATAGGAAAVAGATEVSVLSGSAGMAALSSTLYTIGGSLLMASVAQALAPKPERPDYDGREHTIQSSEIFERISYGRAIVPANLVRIFTFGDANARLIMILLIATQESDAIEGMFISGKRIQLVPNAGQSSLFLATDLIPDYNDSEGGRKFWNDGDPHFGVALYTGAPGQTVDPRANDKAPSNGWPSTCRMTGHTYARVELHYHPSVWQGLPDITFLVRGKKVYDPRTGQSAWSQNPALCIADFLKHKFASPHGIVADTDALIAAANACDAPVALAAGGTKPRYQLNGVVSADQLPKSVLEGMLASMAGTLVINGRTAKLYAGEPRSAVRVLDESAFDREIEVRPRRPRRELVNTVTVWVTDEANNYQRRELPPLSAGVDVMEDGGELRASLDLPWVTNVVQASMLQKLALGQARNQISMTVTMTHRHRDLEPGDIVAVTLPRYGLTYQNMLIRDVKFGSDGKPVAVLEQYDPAIFAWSTADEVAMIGTDNGNVDFPNALSEPASITLGVAVISGGDGVPVPVVTVSVPTATNTVGLRIRWRTVEVGGVSADGTLVVGNNGHGGSAVGGYSVMEIDKPRKNATTFETKIAPVLAYHKYEVEAAYVAGNVAGPAITGTVWISPTSAPLPPDLKKIVSNAAGVSVHYRRPKGKDAYVVEVWGANTNDVGTATLLAEQHAGSVIRLNELTVGVWYLWLYARSAFGVRSAAHSGAPASVSVVSAVGKLAGLDAVTEKEIVFGSAVGTIISYADASESIDSSGKTVFSRSIDVPNDGLTYPLICTLDADFQSQSGSPTGIDIQLRRNGQAVRLNASGNPSPWSFTLSPYMRPVLSWLIELSGGRQEIALRATAVPSGNVKLVRAQFTMTLFKR